MEEAFMLKTRFISEDNTSSKISQLLHFSEEDIVFSDGNLSLSKYLSESAYNIVFIDVVPENIKTRSAFDTIVEKAENYQATIIPIPAIEYFYVKALKSSINIKYKELVDHLLNYGVEPYSLDSIKDTSFEKFCKRVAGLALQRCMIGKSYKWLLLDICNCQYCTDTKYKGTTRLERSRILWSQLPVRREGNSLKFSFGTSLTAVQQYYIKLYNNAIKLQCGVTTTEYEPIELS